MMGMLPGISRTLEGTNRDDSSWMNTSARPGLRAPQNTPWRGDTSAASRWATASPTESPRVSQLSQASVDDSQYQNT
jgi:hypothetical protein